MSVAIRINENLYSQAKIQAMAEFRSAPSQIEYWASVGRAAIDNPDLSVEIIKDLLIAKNEKSETFEFIK
jgi:hypothetical protein